MLQPLASQLALTSFLVRASGIQWSGTPGTTTGELKLALDSRNLQMNRAPVPPHGKIGRRLKPSESLGLNQHEFSKHFSSNVNSLARRRAKRHPECKADEYDL